VAIAGAPLGAVTVNVPLDDALLAKLRSGAGVDSRDQLALAANGRTIAGSVRGVGAAPLDKTADLELGGTDYRTFGVRVVESPTNVDLVALTPRESISGGIHKHYLWTLLAIALTLLTVAALGYAVAPLLTRRDGARDDARALALVGDALASTHDPERLLPVILHATMEATGARGGRVLQDGRITAQEGEVGGHGRPLLLVLGEDEGAGETALQMWPPGRSFDGRTRSLDRRDRSSGSAPSFGSASVASAAS